MHISTFSSKKFILANLSHSHIAYNGKNLHMKSEDKKFLSVFIIKIVFVGYQVLLFVSSRQIFDERFCYVYSFFVLINVYRCALTCLYC